MREVPDHVVEPSPSAQPTPGCRPSSTTAVRRAIAARRRQRENRIFEVMAESMSPMDVVTTFGAAWGAHDLDAVLELVADDCVFDATGPAPDGMRHVGRDAIREAWSPIFMEASSSFEPEETFSADDRVIQRWRYSWTGGHIRGVDLFRVRDGKVVEKFSYVKG
jgi:ketosteroid isomerase-like protein